MATYAVGDLQGCLEPLIRLLDQIDFDPSKDKLWVAGDLINRGPQSLETLRFIKKLGDSAVVVLGNHDLSFLAISEGFQPTRDDDTVDEILRAADCDELCLWLRQQKLVHHCSDLKYTMVHAGIPPQWSINKALKRSAEVESALKDDDQYKDFLLNMFGSTPDIWSKNLKGQDRLRIITNYFTRMRFCSSKGKLEFQAKSGPDSAPKGFAPWFEHKRRRSKHDRLVFGHWAALNGHSGVKKAYALDTGCVWGGCLTIMCLETRQRYSCDCS